MNFFSIFGIFLLLVVGLGINLAYAEIDPILDIVFFQSGELHTADNSFLLSSDLNVREFFNGSIIRVSGITLEGFPYITYTKIENENINTIGKIFIGGEFVELSFIEDTGVTEEIEEKKDDLSIVSQYTQRAHSKQNIFIDIKIFDKEQNKHNNFSQNYGHISDTNIKITITNEEDQEIFSSYGITNEKGLFETKYLVPDNSKRESLTIEITAENNNSFSSKILQAFTLGNIPSNGGSGP